MMGPLVNSIDAAEVYSPLRIVKMASDMGFRAGWGVDLTPQNDDGRCWYSTGFEMRNMAVRKVLRDKPVLLIDSPVCTVHRVMRHTNHARMPEEVVQHRSNRARVHLEFRAKVYNIQLSAGMHFLHEHPEVASSWQERCVQTMLCGA